MGAERTISSHCYKTMAVSGSAEEIWCVLNHFIYTSTMLEVAFILAISLHCASASPLLLHNLLLSRAANTTIHEPTTWASDPSGRGTENILYSCFNTLFLCAWTAFHPNVQFVDSKFWALLQRLKWMFIAVVLPEAILFSAWSQWWAAKDLRDEINRLGQQISGPTQFPTFAKWKRSECVACNPCKKLRDCVNTYEDPTVRRQKHKDCECLDESRTEDNVPNDTSVESTQDRDVHANLLDTPKAFAPWTMAQAFFAVSGGVAIDISPFWHRPYITLTPSGIVFLAEIGLLPRLSKQDAQGRSRADAIAKSITCLQASWFFIQGVARVCAGLPLTLLELHTMIHIICALAMYAIWFSKPYGATSPMICSEPAMVNLGALLTLRCHNGRESNRWSCSLKDEVSVETVRCFHPDADDEEIFAHLDAANKAIGFLRERSIHLPFSPRFVIPGKEGLEFEDKFLVIDVSNMLVRGRFNNGVNKMDTLIARILILVFPLLYCGSHLSAWNFHFPTVVEMWMWRGACLIMIGAPPIFLHFQIVMNPFGEPKWVEEIDEDKWGDRSAMDKTRIVLKYGFFIIHWFLAELFVKKFFLFSRLYLLVESLASLRSPANGTYTTVDWTEYIPHFS